MATKSTFETMFTKQSIKPGHKCGNPKIIKFGKEIDVRTWINEANIDCEIYPTLEKYGSLPRQIPDLQQIIGEMEPLDLRSYLDREIITTNMWESLPLDVRKEFNHDRHLFADKGLEWAQKKEKERIDKEIADKKLAEELAKNNTTGA